MPSPGRKPPHMEHYHISDVIGLLGLPQAPSGRSSYYINCPCCDESPRKRHLNVNLQKDVFRCPRCGVSGGVFDLYSLFTDVPRGTVKAELDAKLGTGFHSSYKPELPEVEECPLTDIATRHETYSALLELLTLAPDHRANLLSRGLTEREIEEFQYRTTPVLGLSAIARELQNKGCYLAGVPGFFRTDDDNWTLASEARGILVPVRNCDGNIQGLQIRRDDVTKRKYRWLSSAERKDGCKAECWVHLRGPVSPNVILTEGPMKADIIYSLSGNTTLAVPGVNGLGHLEEALTQMKYRGLAHIQAAFDMDYMTNYHVQAGYTNLYALLDSLDISYSTLVWDPRYKGLDDYLWEHELHKHRTD